MKLYHFTLDTRLKSILQTGLRAMPLRCGPTGDEDIIKLQRGVWLTECEHTRISPEASAENFKLGGRWHKHWLFFDHALKSERVVRVTVRIGDNDRRLIRFKSNEFLPALDYINSRHWMYLRTITPDKITDVDLEERHAAPDAVSA